MWLQPGGALLNVRRPPITAWQTTIIMSFLTWNSLSIHSEEACTADLWRRFSTPEGAVWSVSVSWHLKKTDRCSTSRMWLLMGTDSGRSNMISTSVRKSKSVNLKLTGWVGYTFNERLRKEERKPFALTYCYLKLWKKTHLNCKITKQVEHLVCPFESCILMLINIET